MKKNKEQRQEAAAERAASKRTPAEQLEHLDTYGYRALKERARLLKEVEDENIVR
jgi:hypothetical protein